MNAAVITGLAFSVVFPALLIIIWKIKTGEKLWSFLAGALGFFIFADILEAILHQVCLNGSNAVSAAITGSTVLYLLYGCLAAGIFEETGRLFGFRVLLKKNTEKSSAAAYGIGHGGMEVILTLGVTYLVYLLVSLGLPLGDEAAANQLAESAKNITMGIVSVAMAERVSAMMIHIGLSMIMFIASKSKGKLWLWPVCIILHAVSDVPACLYQTGTLTSLAAVEIITFAIGAVVFTAGALALKNHTSESEDA